MSTGINLAEGNLQVYDPSPVGSRCGFAGICSSLAAHGYSVRFKGFTAIDRFLELPDLPLFWLETNADIAALAKLIENLRFPGVQIADGAADIPEGTCYFRCVEGNLDPAEKYNYSLPLLSLSYDWQRRRFLDPLGVYPMLKGIREKQGYSLDETGINPNVGYRRIIMDGALLMARYGFTVETSAELAATLGNCPPQPPPGPEIQRAFLNCLLVSPRPDAALEFLKSSGFLNELWPELSCLDEVDHSKEFHPEGNVWNHTLETLRYRKTGSDGAFDLRLSLALLLHDTGKPVSASFGNHRFDGHAELGARMAAHFLNRLGYEPGLINDIFFLVRNHMLPAALKRLPLIKTREIMTSSLFPTLMELYRCDESSSFKALDDFYENSAAYQVYLKNIKNPYRSADGKKVGRKKIHYRHF